MSKEKALLNIAILRKMREQLRDVIERMETDPPPAVSKDTVAKALRDMKGQLLALEFAIEEGERAYGRAPVTLEGNANAE